VRRVGKSGVWQLLRQRGLGVGWPGFTLLLRPSFTGHTAPNGDQPAPFAVRFLSGTNRLRRQLIKGMDWLLM
jgi:hypothetical protein